MAESDSPSNSSTKKPSLCDECGTNPWKYRCPGCSLLTCSLPCVKSHKERTSCTGKRKRTEFVPLAQFDDSILLSDYDMLEETKRLVESAHRTITGFGSNIRFRLPMRLHMLRNAAKRRRTRLLVLPQGMSMRQKNQSRYDRRNDCIYWTVEWRFHSTDVILMDHDVDERVNLSTILEKHLAPSPWSDQLKSFRSINLDDLKLFIRKNAKGTKSPYCQLNIRAPIGQQLQNTMVVEFPVIHVFLPSHCYDFEVEKTKSSIKKDEKSDSANCLSSPKGVAFREEEIEEGELPSDTVVVDLMHCKTYESCNSTQIDRSSNASANGDKYMPALVAQSLEPFPSEKHEVPTKDTNAHLAGLPSNRCLEEDKFDFEQEVKDACSDLIGELNPDDFLCFDAQFSGEDEETSNDFLSFVDDLFEAEDLEEGEISG
ncbi:uncharacterized protein LOC141830951 [Curcuma longa]|uniref:uncharacterized protein LOC141830951 n=1 Tax=Curcuma longa TaxID=136217 RepID=UPI003D9E2571